MELNRISKFKFYRTAKDWEVDKEYVDVIYYYLVYGFSPGSFFTSLLANDAFGAISCSHPANAMSALKNLVGWLNDTRLHGIAYGNYDLVNDWLKMDADARRLVLESRGLIFSEEEETWMTLKDGPVEARNAPYYEMMMEEFKNA